MSVDSPCFVTPAPGSLSVVYVALGLLLLLVAAVLAAQLRRP